MEYEVVARSPSETEFWILVSLAGGRRHGWAVLTEVDALSDGAVRLRMATLYAAFEKLTTTGLIEVDGEERVQGRLRRYYRLTDLGARTLESAAKQRAVGARTAATRLSRGRGATPPAWVGV